MSAPTPPPPFEPYLYTRAPAINLASGIVLAQALVAACPKSMPPAVKKAVAHLAKVGDAAQQAWADRQREMGIVPDEKSRALDQEGDGSWSNLRARLLAYAGLPVALFPKARRAQEIVDSLFGDGGLGFLRDTYVLQWSAMSVLLKRIDDEGLAADIDKLAGPEFLQHIRNVHPRYEAMVQTSLQRDASQQNLLEHVRLIQRAVVAYATRVCATVEDDDSTTIEAARDALAAIDKMRLMAANKRGSNAEAELPAEPPAAPGGLVAGATDATEAGTT
ncbi:MAG: hypothetical protein ACMG6S_33255 [Byssovorax sp.]